MAVYSSVFENQWCGEWRKPGERNLSPVPIRPIGEAVNQGPIPEARTANPSELGLPLLP